MIYIIYKSISMYKITYANLSVPDFIKISFTAQLSSSMIPYNGLLVYMLSTAGLAIIILLYMLHLMKTYHNF